MIDTKHPELSLFTNPSMNLLYYLHLQKGKKIL